MSVILITEAGFIGSHTSLVLLDKGYSLYIIDSWITAPLILLKE